jgi:hypothetical protein
MVLRHPNGAIHYQAWYRDGELIEERGDPSGGLDPRYKPSADIPTA